MTTCVRWMVAATTVMGLAACGGDDDPSASFTTPVDGATVVGGVTFDLEADGITIEAAGRVNDGAGHFHVVADVGCADVGDAIPRDADHVHLGDGSAEGLIYLGPGTHDLCVQIADGAHVATDITDTITVDVAVRNQQEWCAVVGEVDELFLLTDTSGQDFAANQVGYENVQRLLSQLTAGIEHVDADAREAVTAAVEWATAVSLAFTESVDIGEAEDALAPLFADDSPVAAAEPWVRDTCGVDIDD